MATSVTLCVSASLIFLLQLSAVNSIQQCSQTTNSHLWKVGVNPPVYLFGTLHVPYSLVWDTIPSNVKTAFSSSRDVFLELKLSDRETSDDLNNCQFLPNGKTIDEVLTPQLVTRIENYFEKIRRLFSGWLADGSRSSLLRGGQSYSNYLFGAIIHEWKRKRPIWVLTLISSLTEENIQLRKKPVLDRFLDNAARSLGKKLAALETVNDHCQPLNRLENNQVQTALRIQLDYLDSLPSGLPGTMDRDLATYTCGDFRGLIDSQPILPLPPLSTISNITSEERGVLEEVETLLYNRLTTRRNRRITKKIAALLRKERTNTAFIAVGAGHLIGRKSIIDRLRRKGYAIHHLQVNETIEGPSLPNNIMALGDPGSVAQPILVLPEQNTAQQPRLALLSVTELDSTVGKFFGRREKRSTHIESHRERQTVSDEPNKSSNSVSSARTTTGHQTPLLSVLLLLFLLCFTRLH